MRYLLGVLLAAFILTGCSTGRTQGTSTQRLIEQEKKEVEQWAKDPVIVNAVIAQNAHGPIPGMTNARWAGLAVSDPIVVALMRNKTGEFLAKKASASDGLICEAFVCAGKGEKVGYISKPTSYSHAGAPKFEVPMTGQKWQGPSGFDESSQTRSIQIALPVFDHSQPIGVIIVGLSVEKLEKGE